jgi:hypothetical protein
MFISVVLATVAFFQLFVLPEDIVQEKEIAFFITEFKLFLLTLLPILFFDEKQIGKVYY